VGVVRVFGCELGFGGTVGVLRGRWVALSQVHGLPRDVAAKPGVQVGRSLPPAVRKFRSR
jgi:hypothetical protein